MKRATWLRMMIVLFVLTLLLPMPGAALAQDDADDSAPEVPVEGDPAMYPDILDLNGESQIQGAEADLVLAQPPYTMNYQGYLTDNSGVPVDGAFNFEAQLFDAATVGNLEWGPELHNDVPVKSGLFNLVLGSSVLLRPNVFDEALFLQLTVAGTTLPRQPLRTTAYAFGLVPGAEVNGTPPAGTNHSLYVRNAAGDVGIRSADFVVANGFRSSQDSFVFVPGHMAIPVDGYESASVKIAPEDGGRVAVNGKGIIFPFIGAERTIYLPIQLPAVQFGQNVTVEQIQLYYELLPSDDSYITQVLLEQRNTATDGLIILMLNSTVDQKGSGVRTATYTPDPASATLSSSTGPLSLRIRIHFRNGSDTVYIYGARLRLGHQ